MKLTSRALAAAFALALLLTACGEDGEQSVDRATSASSMTETEETPTDTSETSAAQAAAVCDIVTVDQVSAATGRQAVAAEESTLDISPDGETYCSWTDADDEKILNAVRYAAPLDVEAQIAELRSGLFVEEDAPPPGVGVDSFYRLAGYGELAALVFTPNGQEWFKLSLRNPSEVGASEDQEAQGRTVLVDLAQQVVDAG